MDGQALNIEEIYTMEKCFPIFSIYHYLHIKKTNENRKIKIFLNNSKNSQTQNIFEDLFAPF